MSATTPFSRVAVVGTGGYGGKLLRALLRSGAFTTVRAVTRTVTAPHVDKEMRLRELRSLGAEVVEYEDSTAEAFQEAFADIGTVISAVGPSGINSQFAMIDGAVAAGVKWFIPSEFALPHYPSKWLPFDSPMAGKVKVEEYLAEKSKSAGLAYTIIYTGLSLDYIDPRILGLKLTCKSATLVGRGGTPMSFTSTSDTIRVIVDVASRPREMRNRTIRYAGSTSNMRELVKIVTDNDRGENVKLVSVESAKSRFCELARKQDPSAFQIYCRLAVEEGAAHINRKREPLDNNLFPDIKPEPVDATLRRMIKEAEASSRLDIKSNPAWRSATEASATDGLE